MYAATAGPGCDDARRPAAAGGTPTSRRTPPAGTARPRAPAAPQSPPTVLAMPDDSPRSPGQDARKRTRLPGSGVSLLATERGRAFSGPHARNRRSVCWPSPIGIAARAAPNRGLRAGLLRVESAAVGSRTGAVVPELLLVAGTGLPAALFPGFVMRHGEGPPGWSGSAADLRTMRETPDQARTDHGAATPGATSRQAPARL